MASVCYCTGACLTSGVCPNSLGSYIPNQGVYVRPYTLPDYRTIKIDWDAIDRAVDEFNQDEDDPCDPRSDFELLNDCVKDAIAISTRIRTASDADHFEQETCSIITAFLKAASVHVRRLADHGEV